MLRWLRCRHAARLQPACVLRPSLSQEEDQVLLLHLLSHPHSQETPQVTAVVMVLIAMHMVAWTL